MSKRKGLGKGIKELYTSLGRSLFLCLVAFFTIVVATAAWFVNNTNVSGGGTNISASGDNPNFELATVGSFDRGVYDDIADFGITLSGEVKTYGGIDYHIINGENSLRLTTDNNINNIISGHEIKPGDKGKTELYVLCKNKNHNITLISSLELYLGNELGAGKETLDRYARAHIMTFLNRNEDGTYENKIDYNSEYTIDLKDQVYSDENVVIYKIVFYWVWPKEFHNLVYTNRNYNKNLFNNTGSPTYIKIQNELNDQVKRKDYFVIKDGETFPAVSVDMESNDYLHATDRYNQVDELIGSSISYIKLSVKLVR